MLLLIHFFDGGRYTILDLAMKQVGEMLGQGASIIDVGAMSSRPGAKMIRVEEELNLLIPVVTEIKRNHPGAIISVDTVHAVTAKKAIETGASMVNDISGGNIDNTIWEVARDSNVPYILMHMKGLPENMQQQTEYDDVVLDVLKYLRDMVFQLRSIGMKDIVIDPGFGFGKTVDQNYSLLARLKSFEMLECPNFWSD